jgi:hypothetical protein
MIFSHSRAFLFFESNGVGASHVPHEIADDVGLCSYDRIHHLGINGWVFAADSHGCIA